MWTTLIDFLDITIKASVPYVRDLMNNVLIDIPYFMRCVLRLVISLRYNLFFGQPSSRTDGRSCQWLPYILRLLILQEPTLIVGIASVRLVQNIVDLMTLTGNRRNRIYRLWCARNPGFESNGRVVRVSQWIPLLNENNHVSVAYHRSFFRGHTSLPYSLQSTDNPTTTVGYWRSIKEEQ